MNTQIAKKTFIATIAAAALAGLATVSFTQEAEAGGKRFWRGVGAGVVAGVIIGETVRKSRKNKRTYTHNQWEAHVDWCYDNRPRYRERDNTFRYTGGRRRHCVSPYAG